MNEDDQYLMEDLEKRIIQLETMEDIVDTINTNKNEIKNIVVGIDYGMNCMDMLAMGNIFTMDGMVNNMRIYTEDMMRTIQYSQLGETHDGQTD